MATAKFNRPAERSGFEDPSRTVTERIEVERRRLQKASGVPPCLVYCVNHDAEDIDPADVASVAVELIERAVNALDPVELTRGPSSRSSAGI